MSHTIRPFAAGDIRSALALCRAAGWNQLHDDWSRLIAYEPKGCFAAEINGRLVGSITTTRYGTDLAWIGMMLVHEDFRRRGIATELMNAGLGYLRDQRVGCIKLDATPAGEPVYERLGFQAECSFRRWARDPLQPDDTVGGAKSGGEKGSATQRSKHSKGRSGFWKRTPVPEPLTPSCLAIDRVAFGADRSRWLQRLADGSSVRVHANGFGMFRPGHLASYLGPVIAEDFEAARQIIVALLSESEAKVFWDLPQDNLNLAALAGSLGFKPVRDLTRMWTGAKRIAPAMDLQFALSDPGTG